MSIKDKAKYIKLFLENEIGVVFIDDASHNYYRYDGNRISQSDCYRYDGNLIDHKFALVCFQDYFALQSYQDILDSLGYDDFDHKEIKKWLLERFSNYEYAFRRYESLLKRLRE